MSERHFNEKGGQKNWLQAEFDEPSGLLCMDVGCTTCGGTLGRKYFDELIGRHTSEDATIRAAELAQALEGLRITRQNSGAVTQLLEHLRRPHPVPRPWIRDVLTPETRNHPPLKAAAAHVLERLAEKERRRCAAYDRWKRRQPPEWHEAQARAKAEAEERSMQNRIRSDPRWLDAYRAAKKAAAAHRQAQRLLAKIEREIRYGKGPPPRRAG